MSFRQDCYDLLSKVPSGQITTYKAIATALHSKAYRAVGTAMANNPNPIIVPCHRVVNNNGEIGQYALGVNKKILLLENEGVKIKNGKVEKFKELIYTFQAN